MDIIDTLTADQVEIGDVIRIFGEDIEVTDKEDSGLSDVTITGWSLDNGGESINTLPFDETVELLGA